MRIDLQSLKADHPIVKPHCRSLPPYLRNHRRLINRRKWELRTSTRACRLSTQLEGWVTAEHTVFQIANRGLTTLQRAWSPAGMKAVKVG